MRNLLLLLVTVWWLSGVFGQTQEMQVRVFNFDSFSERIPDTSSELYDLTPDEFQDHPEFGILPTNAPCTDCYELLQYRTDSSRLFVEKGSEGTKFYSQKANGPLHYLDENGNYLFYDHRLKPTSTSGLYIADKQDTPIELDINNQETRINLNNGEIFTFNKVSMFHQANDGTITNLGTADWTDYTVGEDGIKITNAWPGVDVEMQFSLDKIKTNYIINQNLGYTEGFLVFRDEVDHGGNLTIHTDPSADLEYYSELPITEIQYSNTSGMQVLVGKAFGYDQSGIKEHSASFGYDVDANHFDLVVPVEWMNQSGMVYPLIVDPSVTSSATYSAGLMRFRYNGSFCVGPNPDCQYTLTVPRPANSTLTAASFDIVQTTAGGSCFFSCWMSDAGFYFQTSCGVDGYWGCNTNAPGTCTGVGLDFSGLISCLAPACSGNVDFDIFNSYCYCSVGGACGASCQSINNNSWVITLTGSTLETLGNTATGNGTTTIVPPNCTGTTLLDPLGANGVPGYTYSWNTGATTPTINVPNSPVATYTCTVTDACGVSRVATFNIDICTSMLAVELINFSGEQSENNVALNWTTQSELNNDYFLLEKRLKDGTFEVIGKVDGQGNSSIATDYSFIDETPHPGNNSYRLTDVDNDGKKEHSQVLDVKFNPEESNLKIIPNPSNGIFDIRYAFPYTGTYTVEIYSSQGSLLDVRYLEAEVGVHQYEMDFSQLDQGTYTIVLITNKKRVTNRLVVK